MRELASRVPNKCNNSLSLQRNHGSSGHGSDNKDCGSRMGVVRTWLSHVSRPFLALGPTNAVYSWCDPYHAELELRQRLDDLTAGHGKDSSFNEGIIRAFSDVGVVLWSKDVASEAIAERARLLYHLGICLHQQITRFPTIMYFDAANSCGEINSNSMSAENTNSRDSLSDIATDGAQGWARATRRGRFELAMAATEALSRAYELGYIKADHELRLLRTDVAAEDEKADVDREMHTHGNSAESSASKIVSKLDSDEFTARLLEQVAIVTISNLGYSDYTLNAMASLQIHCQLSCVLQVVCLDRACFRKLSNSFEGRKCAEPTVHLAVDLLAPNETVGSNSADIGADVSADNGERLSSFEKYKTDSFNAIVRYKFEAILYFLARKRVVVYTDGDVVFLRRSFLRESVSSLGMWRGGNGGSQLELLAQCDATHSERRCDLHICSGYMAILSTSDTRRLFEPSLVFADVKYLASFEDQMYLHRVVPRALPGRVDTLPRHHFPNGIFRAGPYYNITHARMVHFNHNIGHAKAEQMALAGLWFINETTGDTKVNFQW